MITMPMKKNDVFKAKITDMTNLGAGVAKIPDEPYTVFVQGGVTGDEALLRCIKTAHSYAVARIEKLTVPSPHRIEPVCPVWKRCGGCSFAHVSHPYELEIKRSTVETFMKKEGFAPDEIRVHPVYTDGAVSGYRNKVQYPVSGGRIGFYARKTHDVIENDGCFLQYPIFDDIICRIRSLGIPENVRHICMRASGGKNVMLIFVVYASGAVESGYIKRLISEFPEITTVAENVNPEDTNVIFGKDTRILYGSGYIEDVMCGLTFRISPTSFYQVNGGMAEKLYEKAAELAALEDGESLLDMFCGTGTIGLSIISGKKNCRLTGVEIVPEAVGNAVENARINGIGNADFVCADAVKYIAEEQFDCIVVDPPRKGLGEELCAKLAESAAKRIVYISCSPDTLARDLRYFKDRGLQIGDLYPFDMFPRTGHVETVVLMTRTDAGKG